jgi:hypothetical protein
LPRYKVAYNVTYQGFAEVDAGSPQEARELVTDGEFITDPKQERVEWHAMGIGVLIPGSENEPKTVIKPIGPKIELPDENDLEGMLAGCLTIIKRMSAGGSTLTPKEKAYVEAVEKRLLKRAAAEV